LIHFIAVNDGLIPYQGSINYYERVLARMGGVSEVRKFYRFYLIPGMAHGISNGTSNPDANPPLPRLLEGDIYKALTEWVEKGIAPEDIVLKSAGEAPVPKSMPMCADPKKVTYVGGDIYTAASYACR
jgi:feruloyl esterase